MVGSLASSTLLDAAGGVVVSAATFGRSVLVNGLPGFVSWRGDGAALSVLSFTIIDGRNCAIAAIVDPLKLAQIDLPNPA